MQALHGNKHQGRRSLNTGRKENMNTNGQYLTFNALSSFEDIDFKIKEMGKYWRSITDIKISYAGGSYRVEMIAHERKEQEK